MGNILPGLRQFCTPDQSPRQTRDSTKAFGSKVSMCISRTETSAPTICSRSQGPRPGWASFKAPRAWVTLQSPALAESPPPSGQRLGSPVPHRDCGGQLTLRSEDPMSALKTPFTLPAGHSLCLAACLWGLRRGYTPGTSALLLCEQLPS